MEEKNISFLRRFGLKSKNVLKFIAIELTKSILRIFMLGLAILVITKFLSFNNRTPRIPERTFVEMSIGDKLTEETNILPFVKTKGENFYSLLNELEEIKKDRRVKGLILNLDTVGLNRAQREEFKEKLKELKKSGKQIFAYTVSLYNENYQIAIEADKIVMPNTSWAGSNIIGYHSEYLYYKNLGDKLGIEAEVIHVGDFKSYGETYTRNNMSEELRSNTTRILDKVYDNFLEEVSLARNIPKSNLDKLILSGDLALASPNGLKEMNIIDETMYYEEMLEREELSELLDINDYHERRLGEKISKIPKKNKIALIYLEGLITYEENMAKEESIIPSEVLEKLEKIEEHSDVKGVVIRINSGGGSALASDIIYKAVTKVKKPVYISIGGAAASGGYYIASAGNKIYADKESITGSIGVVSIIPNVEKLMKKIGVTAEEISRGKYSNLYALTKSLTDEGRKKIYNSTLEGYQEFLNKVAISRKMKVEEVEEIAQGKVWLGEEAKNLGLVDEIGGLEKTIKDMAENLNLKDYEVVETLESQSLEEVVRKFLPKNYFSKTMISEKVREVVERESLPSELYLRPIVYEPNLEIYY